MKILGLQVAALCLFGVATANAQGVSQIQPVHSFGDVPPVAKSAADVKARYGKVTTPDGKQESGDTATEAVAQRIAQWTQQIIQNMAMAGAGASGPGGPMNSAGQQAIRDLTTAGPRVQGEYTQEMQKFETTRRGLEDTYHAAVNKVDEVYGKKYLDCLTKEENKQKVTCDRHEKDQPLLDAGTDYLTSLAAPFGEYQQKMQGIAAEADAAITGANKAFGASPPAMARPFSQMALMTELQALAAVIHAEDDAVVLVHGQSVQPTLEK